MLLLGTRRSELLSARWRDFDFSAGTWKVATSKSGKENLLPLPEAAIAILRSLANFQTGEWVFPGAGKSGHLQEPRKAWERIRARAKIEDCTIHDLRRTLGSWLAGQGLSLPMIGRVLGHKSLAQQKFMRDCQCAPDARWGCWRSKRDQRRGSIAKASEATSAIKLRLV